MVLNFGGGGSAFFVGGLALVPAVAEILRKWTCPSEILWAESGRKFGFCANRTVGFLEEAASVASTSMVMGVEAAAPISADEFCVVAVSQIPRLLRLFILPHRPAFAVDAASACGGYCCQLVLLLPPPTLLPTGAAADGCC